MKRTNNPVSYNVVTGGPLDTKEGVKQGFSASESCDLMFFGPVYSSLHADTRYSHRNSLIPSWNVGVVKFWIIRKECDAEMNRKIPSRFRQRSSKAFKPIHDLDKVLKATKPLLKALTIFFLFWKSCIKISPNGSLPLRRTCLKIKCLSSWEMSLKNNVLLD